MMLGVNLENTTSNDFRLTATARYLAFDVGGSGSELRLDGTIGSDPGVGAEWYRPFGRSPVFVAPYAGLSAVPRSTTSKTMRWWPSTGWSRLVPGRISASTSARSATCVSGPTSGETTARIEVGDPNRPEVAGRDAGAELTWRTDTQDSPVVPSGGVNSQVRLFARLRRAGHPIRLGDVPVVGLVHAAGRRCQRVLEGGIRRASLRVRQPRHDDGRGAAADLGVRSRDGLPARRVLGRGTPRGACLARWGRLPEAARTPAGLHRWSGLRRRLGRERRRVRRLVECRLADSTPVSASSWRPWSGRS